MNAKCHYVTTSMRLQTAGPSSKAEVSGVLLSVTIHNLITYGIYQCSVSVCSQKIIT